ncbi:hypothetical protein Tco_1446977 [Tanacetum coccineum]
MQLSAIGQEGNFKQTPERSEIEVLKENLELIKRQIGLEHVTVLSVADPDVAIKAGRYVSLLKQSPPSPGSPTSIFLTKEDTSKWVGLVGWVAVSDASM